MPFWTHTHTQTDRQTYTHTHTVPGSSVGEVSCRTRMISIIDSVSDPTIKSLKLIKNIHNKNIIIIITNYK